MINGKFHLFDAILRMCAWVERTSVDFRVDQKFKDKIHLVGCNIVLNLILCIAVIDVDGATIIIAVE